MAVRGFNLLPGLVRLSPRAHPCAWISRITSCPAQPAPTALLQRPARRLPFASASPPNVYCRSLCTETSQPNPTPKRKPKTVRLTFIDRDGDEHTVDGKVGDSLLEVAKEFDIDIEGACEGTLSCSTCHLILEPEWFDKVPDPVTEEEQDMLDLAFGLTDTSRLGCQILVSEALEGIKLKLPAATKDIRNT